MLILLVVALAAFAVKFRPLQPDRHRHLHSRRAGCRPLCLHRQFRRDQLRPYRLYLPRRLCDGLADDTAADEEDGAAGSAGPHSQRQASLCSRHRCRRDLCGCLRLHLRKNPDAAVGHRRFHRDVRDAGRDQPGLFQLGECYGRDEFGCRHSDQPQSSGPMQSAHSLWLSIAYLYAISRSGLALRSARDEATAAAASGVDITRERLIAFTLSGVIMGLGGALYAHSVGVVTPDTFYLGLTFISLSMLVVGGMNSLSGRGDRRGPAFDHHPDPALVREGRECRRRRR